MKATAGLCARIDDAKRECAYLIVHDTKRTDKSSPIVGVSDPGGVQTPMAATAVRNPRSLIYPVD